MRTLGRSKPLTKYAILKSVVVSRFILTVHTNLRFFSSALPYSFIYTNTAGGLRSDISEDTPSEKIPQKAF